MRGDEIEKKTLQQHEKIYSQIIRVPFRPSSSALGFVLIYVSLTHLLHIVATIDQKNHLTKITINVDESVLYT